MHAHVDVRWHGESTPVPASVHVPPAVSTALAPLPGSPHYSRPTRRQAQYGRPLPSMLRAGIEALSGMDMGKVRVHHDSTLPHRVDAEAFARDNEIHLAPGQERHLPHEAWHVVQQREGRVRPTTELGGARINDDAALEREAEQMGRRALRPTPQGSAPQRATRAATCTTHGIVQRVARKRIGRKKRTTPKVSQQKKGKWFTSFDPYTTFGTNALATRYHRQLRANGMKARRFRVPTLYTYTHVRSHNQLTHALQGPHTIAHRLTLNALQNITTLAEIKGIFDEQVRLPADVNKMIDDEKPSGGYTGDMALRIARYLADYATTYKALDDAITANTTDIVRAKHKLNKLLNLDPYATYGWKTAKKASARYTKGKGENVPSPTYEQLSDRPPPHFFRHATELDGFIALRRLLYNRYKP